MSASPDKFNDEVSVDSSIEDKKNRSLIVERKQHHKLVIANSRQSRERI